MPKKQGRKLADRPGKAPTVDEQLQAGSAEQDGQIAVVARSAEQDGRIGAVEGEIVLAEQNDGQTSQVHQRSGMSSSQLLPPSAPMPLQQVNVDEKMKNLLDDYKKKKQEQEQANNEKKEEEKEEGEDRSSGEEDNALDEFTQREDRVVKAGFDAIMRKYSEELNKEVPTLVCQTRNERSNTEKELEVERDAAGCESWGDQCDKQEMDQEIVILAAETKSSFPQPIVSELDQGNSAKVKLDTTEEKMTSTDESQKIIVGSFLRVKFNKAWLMTRVVKVNRAQGTCKVKFIGSSTKKEDLWVKFNDPCIKLVKEKHETGGKDSENVMVVARCRPMNEKDQLAGYDRVIQVDEARGTISVSSPSNRFEPRLEYKFDMVIGPNRKQIDIYNAVARPIVQSVLESYNGTLFAYGQTGSGKTFTMEGIPSVPELGGIIPNSFAHIFGVIAESEADVKYMVSASYIEICNGEVRNLLDLEQTAMEVIEQPDGVCVKDLEMRVVQNKESLNDLLAFGNKHRAVCAIDMNTNSSRSHAVFTIQVDCNDKGPDGKDRWRTGRLNLVDLASEQLVKGDVLMQREKKPSKIDISMSAFYEVVSSLISKKFVQVPYKASALTSLLQDSLGGTTKTTVIAHVGPADYNYDESISTLRYALRMKNIKNKPKINGESKDVLLRQYQKEIEDLRKMLEEGGDICGRSKGLSKENLAEVQEQIDADRRKLASQKNMEEDKKRKVEDDLSAKEAELAAADIQQTDLVCRLLELEKSILVGGGVPCDMEQNPVVEQSPEGVKLLQSSSEHSQTKKRAHSKRSWGLGLLADRNCLARSRARGEAKRLKVKKTESIAKASDSPQPDTAPSPDLMQRLTSNFRSCLLRLLPNGFVVSREELLSMTSDELAHFPVDELFCRCYDGLGQVQSKLKGVHQAQNSLLGTLSDNLSASDEETKIALQKKAELPLLGFESVSPDDSRDTFDEA